MQKLNIHDYTEVAYRLRCSNFDLENGAQLMSCVVTPKTESTAHRHFEEEIFIFLAGRGYIKNIDECIHVRTGDVVRVKAHLPHAIGNDSDTDDLKFLSIYWIPENDTHEEKSVRETLIFSTPPTPNGDLHLGHISGPYLAADLLLRIQRLQGHRSAHLTGRDDHQTYVATKANNEGLTAVETADRFAHEIQATWENCGISTSGMIVPDQSGSYAGFVRHCIKLLFDRGLIYARSEEGMFDDSGIYLHEGYITGKCPHCSMACDGNACEACGRPNSCTDLVDPKTKIGGQIVHKKDVERLYFRLSKFADYLTNYAAFASMSTAAHNVTSRILSEGLRDICVSHPTEWGLKHDIEGYENHVVYVWFEMAFGYLWSAADQSGLSLSAAEILARAKSAYENKTIVHCYGFDNTFYHTLFFPAIYAALGIKAPSRHVVNELLDLDGKKFSTSRLHLIWAKDLLEWISADYLRFALSYYRPEGTRSNFNLTETQGKLNDVFYVNLNGWFSAVIKQLEEFDNVSCEPGAWTYESETFYKKISAIRKSFLNSMELSTFSPRDVATLIEDLIKAGNRFSIAQNPHFQEPLTITRDMRRTAVALQLYALKVLMGPLMTMCPSIGQQLSAFLVISPSEGLSNDFLPSNIKLRPKCLPSLPITCIDTDLTGRARAAKNRGR